MTGFLIVAAIAGVIGALIYFNRAGKREGEAGTTARTLDAGLKGLDHARKAVDDARRDADARELRRRKYRG